MERRQLCAQELNICMVSDFFYPNMGGVEHHLFFLSQCLIQRGHKVVIITHAYGDRTGVRWMSNGLKVYYLPIPVMYNSCSVPEIYLSFPLMRYIFLRESIDVVHGHQAFSIMCHEAIFHARTMGIPCCFTDHSLFGFADTSSILTNKLLKITLSDVDNVICVSNTSKENTVLRAALNPKSVFVIPNAVVAEQFTPDASQRDPKHITIVVVSRLVYRKGVDLLVAIIPGLCLAHPYIRFVIAGDGPKRVDLEQMREQYMLHDRVELLGAVASQDVRNVLVRGHIFLNTSLTDAFCMAVVEAACCGLLVVSTKVGGIPEVLPEHMLILSKPEADHLTSTVNQAIEIIQSGSLDTSTFHSEVTQMYSWSNVAERTEKVYLRLGKRGTSSTSPTPLIERLRRYYGCGELAGKLVCLHIALNYVVMLVLNWLYPAHSITKAPKFDNAQYQRIIRERMERQADASRPSRVCI